MTKGTHSYIEDTRNESILININGQLFPRQEAKISVFDSGFLLGDGVWEGIRLLNGQLVFIKEHMERLFGGAKILLIDIGFTPVKMIDLIRKTLEANNMETGVHLRVIVSRGLKKTPYQHPNANSGSPTVVIIPEYKEADSTVNKKGICIKTVSIKRSTPEVQDPHINSLSKFNCIAACIEAAKLGADEGLMLDKNGNVSTCNSTNFFIVRNGEVWTSSGEYCLPGITRKVVIDLCKENNISVHERDFQLKEVHSADEAFVTGTFAGLIPAIEIDEKILSHGKRGLLTKFLQELYGQKLHQLYPKSNDR